ncbi:MAG: membrane-bound lytic murein transglycosylase MltF [Rhodocyclaceae bacterium]|nr:membrane-bound lytic murein transglycosylase MltF [Rhodocyclaceae bacterium]
MRWSIPLLLLGSALLLAACSDEQRVSRHRPLPFPTPGQHDLVVLTSPGLLTHDADESGQFGGLEHDLVETFAEELGVAVKYVVVNPDQIESHLSNDRAHLAAAWLTPTNNQKVKATPPIRYSHDLLLQHEASLPLEETSDLAGKSVHVIAGSRQAASLQALQASIAGLTIVESRDTDIFKLLEALSERRIDFVALDSSLADIADPLFPNLQISLQLKNEQPIVWLLGEKPNAELEARANAFILRIQHDGTLAKFDDRYFGHVNRLKQADIIKFFADIRTTLPKYLKYFQAAQVVSGIDWRLIAAVAYQESHWDPNATSHTNVRGIMMLTEETADRLEVSNRLDPSESILAGARYINLLKEGLPDDVEEPDRTWLALAAYNIGPGHFNNARRLAQKLKADPNAWYEMKSVLPKLAQAKYTQMIKASRARGGEAVILVENIRNYYDILLRNSEPLAPEIAGSSSIKRLVAEVTQRRKEYVKKMAEERAQAALELASQAEEETRLSLSNPPDGRLNAPQIYADKTSSPPM